MDKRIKRLEALYNVDFTTMTDADLDAWIAADKATQPAQWQVLESLSDEQLTKLADGDAGATAAFKDAVNAKQSK